LSRKVDQCVGRVDADTREYNQWMNPERSRSRQSPQRLRTIKIRRMAKIDISPIRTDYLHRNTSSMTVSVDQTNPCTCY